ncbi:GntR family transcriptional regulator [Streptomyces sp. NPDC002055]|uniref:GntR family transcriptional regulator n=1 Tax=Streptomyces sp. NPDC002055 TaxID=3154534 RepID=UPI00332075C0
MAAASGAAVREAHNKVDQYINPWASLAARRHAAASTSPADQARWSRLIQAVERPEQATQLTYEKLVLRVVSARELLRTLAETEPPFVPIVDVARQIEHRIKTGSYPAGTVLAPGRLAADLAFPLQSIHLALADLAERGVIEQQTNCRARVPGGDANDRPRQIAQWLRALAEGGAFLPGTALPDRRELMRILITSQKPVTDALRILSEEGLLERGPHRRLVVRRGAVERPTSTLKVPRPRPGLNSSSPHEIREVARTVRGWWNTRLTPPPDALDEVIDRLGVAAHQLVEQIRRGALPPATTHQQVESVIARTAVSAAAVHQPHYQLRVWHAACLARAVEDLLALVDQVHGSHLVDSTMTPLSA